MLRARTTLVALLVSGAFVAACGSDSSSTEIPPVPNIDTISFASSLGINLSTFTKTSYGLYYKDITVGTGPAPVAGDSLFVHYFGYFPTGVVFDSNPTTAAPFGFKVASGDVIPAWDSTALGMRIGGQREIIVPPSLGYGPTANGRIPGNSVLVFLITAVSKK